MTPRSALQRALPLAPLAGVLAYAVVLAQRVPSLVGDTATSDSVGPMVIAESLGGGARGAVVMGNAAHYTTLWFDELTRALPGHRVVWQAMPYVLSLLGLLLLAETVRRLRGWAAALLTLGIGIATPPLLLVPLLAQAYHSTTFVNGIALAALLVWMARRPSLRAPWAIAVLAIVAVITGLDVASDPLLLVVGLAPFVAAAVLVARRDVPVLLAAGGVTLVALATAGITAVVMRHAGYTVVGLPLHLASPQRIADNLNLLGHLVLDMGNGRFGAGQPVRVVCGLLVVVAVFVPVWFLVRVAIRREGSEKKEFSARSEQPESRAGTLAQDLFLAFWGFTAIFLALAFVATTLALDTNSIRYLPPLFYAVAATIPFVRWCTPATIGVTFVGISGALILHNARLVEDFNIEPQDAGPLIALLQSHNLHHGYAGYWQANLLTWESDGDIQSRAVQQSAECKATSPGWFCPYPIFTVASGYARNQQGPTFVIREHGGAFVPNPPPMQPKETLQLGRYDVYVFDGDAGAAAAAETAGWPPG